MQTINTVEIYNGPSIFTETRTEYIPRKSPIPDAQQKPFSGNQHFENTYELGGYFTTNSEDERLEADPFQQCTEDAIPSALLLPAQIICTTYIFLPNLDDPKSAIPDPPPSATYARIAFIGDSLQNISDKGHSSTKHLKANQENFFVILCFVSHNDCAHVPPYLLLPFVNRLNALQE
ncbi:hypothetical protein DM02DRAFT_651244 [Periconia macrospinosa]|uniref:Uncharacterized protein n=1 Tax=Periconia macrospinosa TaxID=97972 RepID=A0A2V1E2K8_9PLEO|nr:hypothetical protein DM02DRAFT_651244 [Periconia macrospinosa]